MSERLVESLNTVEETPIWSLHGRPNGFVQPPTLAERVLPTQGLWGWEGRSAVLANTAFLLPPDELAQP